MEQALVWERFCTLAELEDESAQRYKAICETAVRQIEGLKRPQAGPEADWFLTEAAAALAFYRWTMQNAALGLDGFTAGEVRVERSGANIAFARTLWQEAETAAAPYLQDVNFVFQGVPV